MPRLTQWLAIALLACAKLSWAAGMPCTTPNGGGYFPSFDPERRSVIIFVHGVLGDPVSSWVHSPLVGEDVFWPCLLLKDELFSQHTNIYLHGFKSDKFGSNPSIDEAADQLFSNLDARGVLLQHSHVTFVAHSLGGLIVSRMLLRRAESEVLKRVRLALFLGTPANGAEIARVGKAVSGSVQFSELADDAKLQQWVGHWHARTGNVRTFCGAETEGVFWSTVWGPVVPEASAAALCGGRADRLHGLDHFAIVKPPSPDASPSEFLYNRYARCVIARIRPTSSDAETQAGRNALQWFQTQQARFEQARSGALDPSLAAAAALHPARRYLSTRDGAAGLGRADYELLNANAFALVLRDQLAASFPELVVDSVIRVSRVQEIVKDSLVLDLRDRALNGGVLSESDIALLVRDPMRQDRTLFFVDAAPASAGPPSGGRLKGFVFVADTSRCE